jgi:hypothetical protein
MRVVAAGVHHVVVVPLCYHSILILTQLCFFMLFRPQNVFERIAELWNSSAFNPLAPPSACHEDFMTFIDCCHNLVVHLTPATPQRIQDFFTSTRSDLLRIISNWEMSGQGDGGRENEDATVDDNSSSTSVDIDELPPAQWVAIFATDRPEPSTIVRPS